MSVSSSLSAQLRELRPDSLAGMSAEQMRKLLSLLHEQVAELKQTRDHGSPDKHKYIRKVFTKGQLKQHIKQNLKIIMRRRQRQEQRGGNDGSILRERGLEEGGKSKFEQATPAPQSSKVDNFQAFMRSALKETSTQELSCSICLQILISPALTPCGHTFCLSCLDESTLLNFVCPICRENIKGTDPIVCSLLDNLISAKMELDPSHKEYERYRQRTMQFKTWMAGRMLNYQRLVQGQLVDVRDTESIWCQGTVLDIYSKVDEETGGKTVTGVLVHYNRWHKIYNEIIDVPSHRLAPLSCYSGRIQIPRYNLAEEDNNVRGSVITGPPRIEIPAAFNFIQIMDSNSDSESESLSEGVEGEEENEHEYLSNLDPSSEHLNFEDEVEGEGESQSPNLPRENSSPLGFFGLRGIMERVRSDFISRFIQNRRILYESGGQDSELLQRQSQNPIPRIEIDSLSPLSLFPMEFQQNNSSNSEVNHFLSQMLEEEMASSILVPEAQKQSIVVEAEEDENKENIGDSLSQQEMVEDCE